MLISLIVPCYNEEEAMPLFYQEAARVAAQMEKSHGAEFEIIFVDDGSKDGTLRVARELHDADPRVRYVSFSRNFGKEAGIYAGLKAAKGDYVATLDADLQDPPALLPDMLDALIGVYERNVQEPVIMTARLPAAPPARVNPLCAAGLPRCFTASSIKCRIPR